MLIATTFQTSICIVIVIHMGASAQNIKPPDFISFHSGDTLFGKVEHINQKSFSPDFYKKIRLIDVSGKKKKFDRKKVSGFQSNGEIYEGFWLRQSSEGMTLLNPKYDIDNKNGELFFLKRLRHGALSHYQLEWWEQGESALMSMDLLKKDRDQFFIRATQGVFGLKTKVLKNYLMDCPELRDQIERKQFDAVWQIVDFYNSKCQ